MRSLKLFAAAAILSASAATTVTAGGFAPTVVETPIVVDPIVEGPPSSWGIILPLVGVAALIALAGS
jgi:hypothetical protein